jgi:hypothetical protein
MRAERLEPDRTPAALLRKAAGGLLLGLLLGYLVAWVAPRRRPVSEGAYEAPVPERIDLPSDIDLTLVGVHTRQRSTSTDLRSTQPEGVG